MFAGLEWIYMEVSINGGSQNGWLISWKIHYQKDDLGVPLFQETSIWKNMEELTQVIEMCQANFAAIHGS